MNDYLVRATGLQGKVRLFAARTTDVVEEMRRRHDLFPTAAAAVGRTATAAAMMGAMLKGEEKVTIQVKGNGPIGQIVADANAKGEVRAYADNPHTHLPSNSLGKLDVAGAVGTEGFIYVIKDLGLREPYRGSIPIVSGELAEDFTYYFAKSEQTPSAVSLGVLVDTDYSIKTAGGLILQLLPGLEEDEIAELEKRLAAIPPVTSMLERGLTPEDMMRELVDDISAVERLELRFQCFCSRERVENTLVSLGKEELDAIIEGEGSAEVVCHFCNEKYGFDRTELTTLRERLDAK
ncbi:Hsp33 family molecular chaperone HslO [Paenibacillus antri]|uniref:33 kDa chaperonin n=1 Tax=Paenibacillus antri TaxID=2582848 RepID=A0A5R9G3C8_9BACL|nr:Hsp33 family molecular chaperone HslO [Paenibacillus antri]TLS48620.1 Hsp33 family molecular chaperone HslO [Paenibacillus antri]